MLTFGDRHKRSRAPVHRLMEGAPPRRPDASWLLAAAVLCVVPSVVLADAPGAGGDGFGGWLGDLLQQLRSPLFWFGMAAQVTFFMRFLVQWIVSEKRRRSTVPVAFWYFSLVGGVSLFIYACLKRDLVIMSGQLFACVIYIRNLMLIHDWQNRRRQAGLPVEPADE